MQDEALNATSILMRQEHDHEQQQARMETMPAAEREELDAIRAGNFDDDWEADPENILHIEDFLQGDALLNISHAGGEFANLLDIGDDLLGSSKKWVILVSWYILS